MPAAVKPRPLSAKSALLLQVSRTAAMFTGHSKTVKALLVSEPLWGTAIGWFTVYGPLYMVALGLSSVQVGFISSLVLISQAFGAIVGGYYADRWGRKRTMQLFDSIAWMTSVALWFFATGYWYFVAAGLINGLFYGAIPGWNCLLVENTRPERRASVYAVVNLLFMGSGLLGPIGGFFVAKYGIVTGGRFIYGIGFVLVAAALLVRQLFTEETKGEPTAVPAPATPGSSVLAEFRQTLDLMIHHRPILILFLSQTLGLFCTTIWNAYSGLYMTEAAGLSLPPSVISALPAIRSASMVLMMLLVIPHVTEKRYLQTLIVGGLMVAGSSTVFLVTPTGLFWPLVIYAVLTSAGGAIIYPIRSGYLANVVPDQYRAKIMSLISTMTLVATIPAGPIAGSLFRVSVRLPFYLVLGLQIIDILLVVSLFRHGRKPQDDPELVTSNQ